LGGVRAPLSDWSAVASGAAGLGGTVWQRVYGATLLWTWSAASCVASAWVSRSGAMASSVGLVAGASAPGWVAPCSGLAACVSSEGEGESGRLWWLRQPAACPPDCSDWGCSWMAGIMDTWNSSPTRDLPIFDAPRCWTGFVDLVQWRVALRRIGVAGRFARCSLPEGRTLCCLLPGFLSLPSGPFVADLLWVFFGWPPVPVAVSGAPERFKM